MFSSTISPRLLGDYPIDDLFYDIEDTYFDVATRKLLDMSEVFTVSYGSRSLLDYLVRNLDTLRRGEMRIARLHSTSYRMFLKRHLKLVSASSR